MYQNDFDALPVQVDKNNLIRRVSLVGCVFSLGEQWKNLQFHLENMLFLS